LGYPDAGQGLFGAGQGLFGNEDTRRRRSRLDSSSHAWRAQELKRDATVLDASNSAEAMNIVSQNPDLDLVLLDLTLPDRDGFSVLAD
jgi:CheY-like chemotaxis protein